MPFDWVRPELQKCWKILHSAWEFSAGNVEGKLWLTRHPGESKGETGWHDFCEALPHLPFITSPTWGSGPFGEQCQQDDMPDWLWSRRLCSRSRLLWHDFCRTLRDEVSWGNFTQFQNGPVSRGLDPKNKETVVFIWLSPEWKTI